MMTLQESRVSALASRLGLSLARTHEGENARLYQLVEVVSMTPIYPGSQVKGAGLSELEDWLGFPWE